MAEKTKQVESEGKMSKDMQIGFHQGSITTLVKEREEMLKILQICESLIQLHFKSLKELGFDVSELKKAKEVPTTPKKPIEDILLEMSRQKNVILLV